MAVMGYMWELAAFIGLPLGAWLFNSGSYVLVFGFGLGLYVTACVFGLLRLWKFEEIIHQKDLTLKGLTLYNILTL